MEYGPQNAITGDYGTELPETVVDEQDLVAERNAAKFSKTKEFLALKEYLEGRKQFYQTQLPDGRPVTEAKIEDWKVANLMVAEIDLILNTYQNANEAVKDADRQRS